ncbi:MAG: SRPBCC family protein [Hyphomicrobiales bacterium]|nr:SRPBCC family protein [Hyphomicrobiales bacterium]
MAELRQEFVVAQPRSRVWAVFQEIETVVDCLPGASLTAPPTADHVEGQMTVKLGPIKANFAGQADLDRDEANFTGLIKGSGVDKKQGSRAKGDVRYVLEESDGGAATRVVVTVDYSLSGSLAQFARGGIVEAVAGKLTEQFATNLEAKLAGGGEPAAAPDGGSTTPDSRPAGSSPTPAKPKTNELNALSLIGAVIMGWFRKLLGRK